ncbi:hypothetical protein GQ457_05G015960 [Hibiscus cannabinus]
MAKKGKNDEDNDMWADVSDMDVDHGGGDVLNVSVDDQHTSMDSDIGFVGDKVEISAEDIIMNRKSINYSALENRIRAIWKPVGQLQVIDIDINYYIIRFSNERDYTEVLMQGPWTIYGSYLTVQPWSHSFTKPEKHPMQVIVWVRLPGLTYRYYSKALFCHIATLIGRVIKIDYNTKVGGRGKFACLAILVDLNKPLLSCIRIDGSLQKLEYEGLQHVCYTCGMYGHSKESCEEGKINLIRSKKCWLTVGEE